jgi:hypothetical protein
VKFYKNYPKERRLHQRLRLRKNGGKAEAVRLGTLHLAKQSQFDYIDFRCRFIYQF